MPVPPQARQWGFIRRMESGDGNDPASSAQEVELWLDEEKCRFLIAVDKIVIDDLAPIEFAQFVRALRHSTTQILFKFEIRNDGSVRPYNVWS